MSGVEKSKILYVDDEQENLDGFRFTFRREFEILTSITAEEAKDVLKEHPDIKVIISDQRMPNMKGTEFFEFVAQNYPDVIRIILTAFTDAEAIMEAINKGQVYRFLTKPWNKNELKVTIDNALETYDLKKENKELINDLKGANEKLTNINQNLEKIVEERTLELKHANEGLEAANEELATTNEELNSAVEELNVINDQLVNEVTHRKQAEQQLTNYQEHLEELVERRTEELKQSELRLGTLSDNLPGGAIFRGVITADKDFKLVYVSKQFYKLFSITPDELEEKNKKQFVFENIHKDDLTVLRATVRKSIANIEPLDMELRYVNNDKKCKWIHLKAMPHISKQKDVILDGFIVDINEKKAAAQALLQSEIRYRELFEQAADGIIVGNTKGEIIDANSSICQLLEYDKDELVGQRIETLFSKELLNEKPLRYDLLEKGKGVINERAMLKKSKTEIPIEMSTKKLPNGSLQAFVRDISERIKAQKTISESEEKFRNLFNSSTESIIISDFGNELIEVNDEAVILINMDKKEILRLTLDDIITPSFRKQLKERNKKLKNNLQVPTEEFEIMKKDGLIVPVEISSKVVEYQGGKAVLNMIHDITDRKFMDRKLLDTIIQTEEKERERLARNLHDDLGPLLSSIKMYTNSLLERNNMDKHNYIVDQINDIIKEAIQATKNISNDLSPHILVNYGLESAINSYLSNVPEYFVIKFNCELSMKRYDENIETNFYRIVKELVNNTIKHAKKAKHISIELSQKHKQMILVYKDDGIGFNPEQETPKGMGLFNVQNRINSLNGKSRVYQTDTGGFGCDILVNIV